MSTQTLNIHAARHFFARVFARALPVVFGFVALSAFTRAASSSAPLTTPKQIRALPPDRAKQGLPVRVRGQVLLLSGWKNSFFFYQDGIGISIDRNDTLPELHSGDEVEVVGRTSDGRFAPIIISDHVQVLGRAKLPPAPLRDFRDLVTGVNDSQWLQVRGVVHAARIAQGWGRSVLFLEINLGGADITARVHDFPADDPSYLVDSEVTVRGVCGTNFNDARQLVGLRLFVADMNAITIEKPAPADPFRQPHQALDSLQQFAPSHLLPHRILVSGTVTYRNPGSALYVQEGDHGLYIETQPNAAAVGDKIEALGFVAAGPYSPQLHDAMVRVVGHGDTLIPPAIAASEVIRTNSDGFLASSFDGMLARLRGTLVDRISGADGDVLAIRDGHLLFRALLPANIGTQALSGLKPGSELGLTGVISIQSDQSREPHLFVLRLRSPADIVVIRAASWWDPARTQYALALVTLAAATSFILVVFLRRKIKEQVDEVRHSEERFRLLVTGVKDYAILMLDPQGSVRSWSAGAEKIKGYLAEEILGQHFSRFYPQEDVASGKPARSLKIAVDQGRYEEEGWRVRKDGSQFWASVVITALFDEEKQLRGFGKVTRDITERKRAEDEILRLNSELEAFTYTVAHDLRAPLRHINGFIGILHQDGFERLDDECRRCLDKISRAAQSMGLLLDDLLNFSRLGRMEMRPFTINLNQMVDRIRQELQPDLQDRSVTWQVGDLPEVEADPSLLHQLLFNLIANAVKYTRKRDMAHIEIASAPPENGCVTIFVRDNGAGFEMEYSNKLFKVFQRLHTSEDFEGTGIGLAIVRRIVERHGGRAWAEGAPGLGATFYFSLPQNKTAPNLSHLNLSHPNLSHPKGTAHAQARVHSVGGR